MSIAAKDMPGSLILAVATSLTGLFLLDSMGAIIKYLGATYPPQQLSFLRNLFGLLPSLILLLVTPGWHRAGRPLLVPYWGWALSRGLFVTLAQLCFFTALVHLEFATATTLAFAAPMFVTALSIPVLGDKVGVWRMGAVILGFAGIVMIMNPGSEVFSWYAVLPVGAAFFYASSSVAIKRIITELPSALINLYSQFSALVGSAVILVLTTGFQPVATLHDWLWILAMGGLGGSGVLLLVTAYRMTRPSNLAPFDYFGIVFSFGLGWIFFGEAPFDRLFPGVLAIVIGGLVIFWREKTNRERD